MANETRLVVVGVGLIGAATLRYAAAAGAEVVGIGPGEPVDRSGHPGPFASHHDSGRITRLLDASPIWAELARRSIEEYPIIARRSEIEFHRPVGVLWASGASAGLDELAPVGRLMGIDAPVRPFSLVQTSSVGLASTDATLFEPAPAGHIDPRAMLRAQLDVAVRDGATVIDDVVEAMETDGDGVTVITRAGRRIRATTAVLAAGAYTGFLAGPHVPIVPTTEAIVLGEVTQAEAEALATLPAVIRLGADGSLVHLYLVPPVRYPDGRWYVKLGAETDADAGLGSVEALDAWMAGDGAEERHRSLVAHLESLLPAARFERFVVKPCVYARTSSGLPFVDHLSPRVVIAAGGNGRAAKSADALGSLAARLALGGDWDDPLSSTAFALPL